jgi:branched-chain amino acid transport system ATP-binding protein
MSEPTTSDRGGDPVLEVRSLAKSFGGVDAVDGVDLTVMDGELVSIVGPNGAGKSTTFNCIMNLLSPDEGTIRFRDRDIRGLRTAEIVQSGISRTFQLARVYDTLTVRETMKVNQPHANESMVATLFRRSSADVEARITELLSLVDLADMESEPAESLSTGQQKLLNLASSLLRDPDLILLDEPTAGVNPALVENIIEFIRTLNEDGQTFLLIEHDMNVVRKISDHVYVLADGTNLTAGPPTEALDEPEVLEAYFGQ